MATKKAATHLKKAASGKAAKADDHEGHDHGPDEPCDLNSIAREIEPAVTKALGPNAAAKVAGPTPAGAPSIQSILNLILVVLQAIMDAKIFDRVARSKGYVEVQSDLFDRVAASRGYAKK